MNYKASLFTLFLATTSKIASAEDLISEPFDLWTNGFEGARFTYGNGVFLNHDESKLISIDAVGLVAAFEAGGEGNYLWDVGAPLVEDGLSHVVECFSGIAFTTENAENRYMVYSLGYKADETTDDTDFTLVIALDDDGNKLYQSSMLEGLPSGTPVISDDGKYIFVTHNSGDRSTGYFTILTESLGLVMTQSSGDGPFSAPGIFHSPAEGFYDPFEAVGTDNTNDMVMWSLAPVQNGVAVPPGTIYGFQFPSDFDGTADSLAFFTLGSTTRGFRSVLPPVMADEGRSAYWATSRSELYIFGGYEGLDRVRFNRGPNLKGEFEEATGWNGQPILSLPLVTTDDANEDRVVFGGSSSTEVYRLSYNFNETDPLLAEITGTIIMNTTTMVVAGAKLDPMKRVVYFVESNGNLHALDFDTLESSTWAGTLSIEDGVQSEMALTSDGTTLYVVSTSGVIRAISLVAAETASPTSSPTDSPSASPVVTPTAPTAAPASASAGPLVHKVLVLLGAAVVGLQAVAI